MTDTSGALPLPRAGRRLALFAAGPAAYGVSWLLARVPSIVEWSYGERLGPALARLLSGVSSVVPFPIFPLLGVGLCARYATAGFRASRDVHRGQRRLAPTLMAGGLVLARDAGIIVAAFYLLWGFHYARRPLALRLGLPAPAAVDVAELTSLAAQLVDAANQVYLEVHGREDAGSPTRLPQDDRRRIWRGLAEGWQRTAPALGLGRLAATSYGDPKDAVVGGLLHRLGIAGMYSPFAGEILLGDDLPAVRYASTLAHEQAHQRGVAGEAEASFAGFVVATSSSEPLVRYAALAQAQRQFVVAVGLVDRARPDGLWARLLPGVRRDLADADRRAARYWGRGPRLASRLNDAYLRSNRVEGGTHNYSQSIQLLVAYARTRDGRILSGSPR